MFRIIIACIIAALAAAPGFARAQNADTLVREQVAIACDSAGGTIDPAAVIARDLTGDGTIDLVISHEGIMCPGRGRSLHCGMQVCAFMVYVRRGGALELALDMLGMMVSVDDGPVPAVRWYGHGGAPHSRRWDGAAFK